MSYVLNTPADQQAMLAAIGVQSIEELFSSIPEAVRLKRPLNVPPALSEIELEQHLGDLGRRIRSANDAVCFLGGGSYDHFIPAVVDAISGRSEFYTAYTPYQAEASQGSLQAFFEYQTLIAQLTGLDVANASLYDGGSAVAEAVLMAMTIHPKTPQSPHCGERSSRISLDPGHLPGQPRRPGDDAAHARRLSGSRRPHPGD